MEILIIVLGVAAFCGFIYAGYLLGVDATGDFLLVGIITIVVFVGLLATSHYHHYRQGQIDALNGDIKYELKNQKDGSKIWEAK